MIFIKDTRKDEIFTYLITGTTKFKISGIDFFEKAVYRGDEKAALKRAEELYKTVFN